MSDSSLLEGSRVVLEWSGGDPGAVCYLVQRRLDAAEWSFYQGGGPPSGVAYDIPQELGIHCYRVALGNEAGQSEYSNEACVNVETLPVFVTPTPPPWPCGLGETPPYSDLGPNAPSNLQTLLVLDGTDLRVDLAWQDNATGELCWGVERRGAGGVWQWFVGGEGDATTAIDGQPSLDDGCYRVWVANGYGRSAFSNEACAGGPAVTVTPTPVTTAGPSTPVTPAAVPVVGAGGRDSTGLPWWIAVAGVLSSLLALSSLSVLIEGHRRP